MTGCDPSWPLSGQISLTGSGHFIAACGPVIMSALLDSPDSRLSGANGAELPYVHYRESVLKWLDAVQFVTSSSRWRLSRRQCKISLANTFSSSRMIVWTMTQ